MCTLFVTLTNKIIKKRTSNVKEYERKIMRERRVNLYKIGVLCIKEMYIDIRYCLNGKTLYLQCSHAFEKNRFRKKGKNELDKT